ncbi:DUF4317 family protein [Clostridium magnum]|uniref:DUF4317 family protein n=1 Tax=Clostridium magnum DSM 2767 TaxID=1121326 RepID=A0A161Y7H8_9CLOT|nr:DUF4317 family protein [Clostridium magnum]KZL94349.1 hypothetical protein CLMAG_14020 [Clostridium magnum DSM 2767]SHJ52527.1 protein of unknown function [Clostridium magnum DSM 2767]
MKKRDLVNLRKEFKLSSYLMPIKETYSVYLKKDNGEIITRELNYFEMMDTEKRELYLSNFKKILTGAIDTKIFELDFKNSQEDNSTNTQHLLHEAISSGNSIVEYADKIVDKISNHFTYDTDIVINFVRAEYYKAAKKGSKESEESPDDYVQAIEFILCSINKVDIPKKALKFDYKEMAFKTNSALDTVINLNSPLDGFMFPSINSEYIDVNKVIYYSSKSQQMNLTFVENVLGCELKNSALQEKESFNIILNIVIGDRIKPETMQEIYESIYEKLEYQEDDEEPVINIKSLEDILNYCGIENTEAVKGAFNDVCGGDYDFKIKNIIPDFYSKSIKIENEYATVEITPDRLNLIKQIVTEEGKRCLLIELNEDVEVNGFKLKNEA